MAHRRGPVEADGTVDAQTASTAPWKTLRVSHKLPQGTVFIKSPTKNPEEPKRDWKLIELILGYTEDNATPEKDEGVPYPKLNGFSDWQIFDHVTLCQEAGFLIVADEEKWLIDRLTWLGHQKLDELRKTDETHDKRN